jgi:hypothetical protein
MKTGLITGQANKETTVAFKEAVPTTKLQRQKAHHNEEGRCFSFS